VIFKSAGDFIFDIIVWSLKIRPNAVPGPK